MVTNFYVIIEDNGKFQPYDVIPYLLETFHKQEEKPKTFEDIKEFIRIKSLDMWWARCQYEIILSDWPNERKKEKWDVHKQVMMNLDTIATILVDVINSEL